MYSQQKSVGLMIRLAYCLFSYNTCNVELLCAWLTLDTEQNGLLFMETSALESTNVEMAFNNVLSGE